MGQYLDRFKDLIKKRQTEQILQIINKERASGQIRSIEEFNTRLDSLIRQLTAGVLTPTLKLFMAEKSKKTDSESHNFMLDRVGDDLEAAFEEAANIAEVQGSHETLVRDVVLKNLQYGIAELESKISVYEFLSKSAHGFDAALFSTFRESKADRAPRNIVQASVLFRDPRTDTEVPAENDAEIDLLGERLTLAFEAQEFLPISKIRQIFDTEGSQSTLIVQAPGTSLENLKSPDADKYWLQSQLFEEKPTLVKVKLEFELAGTRDVNIVDIRPACRHPTTLESIYYLDSANTLQLLETPNIEITHGLSYIFPTITTKRLVLVFVLNTGVHASFQYEPGGETLFEQAQGQPAIGVTPSMRGISSALDEFLPDVLPLDPLNVSTMAESVAPAEPEPVAVYIPEPVPEEAVATTPTPPPFTLPVTQSFYNGIFWGGIQISLGLNYGGNPGANYRYIVQQYMEQNPVTAEDVTIINGYLYEGKTVPDPLKTKIVTWASTWMYGTGFAPNPPPSYSFNIPPFEMNFLGSVSTATTDTYTAPAGTTSTSTPSTTPVATTATTTSSATTSSTVINGTRSGGGPGPGESGTGAIPGTRGYVPPPNLRNFTGWEYQVGFDDIKFGKVGYQYKSLYVSRPLETGDVGQIGLKVIEGRPASTGALGRIEMTDDTYDVEDTVFFHGSIEYWVVKRDYDQAGNIIRTTKFPILPTGVDRVHHERLLLTEKSTPDKVRGDIGYLNFFTTMEDGDVKVYRNGIQIGNVTAWEDITEASDTIPDSGTKMRFKIQILEPLSTDIYTVSYTPLLSTTRAVPTILSAYTPEGQSVVDLVGDLSVRSYEEQLLLVEGAEDIDSSELFLVIVLRNNVANPTLTPTVEEYMLVVAHRDSEKFAST